jgi:hypothetical protein
MALYDPAPPAALSSAQAILLAAAQNPHSFADRLQGSSVAKVLNLVQLATYMRQLPDDYEQFSMSYYHWKQNGSGGPNTLKPGVQYECGTSACAVGHGPAAGIAPLRGEDDWVQYGRRSFTSHEGDYLFMFSGSWTDYDDTPRGVAARICYVLQQGSLPDFNTSHECDEPITLGYMQYMQTQYAGYLA